MPCPLLQAAVADMKTQLAALDDALKAKAAEYNTAKAAAANAAEQADARLAAAQVRPVEDTAISCLSSALQEDDFFNNLRPH